MDNGLYKWVTGSDGVIQVTGCMLLQEPFAGMVIELGQAEVDSDTGELHSFNWKILDNPDLVDTSDGNINFHKYLQMVVISIIKDGMHEANIPEPSRTD